MTGEQARTARRPGRMVLRLAGFALGMAAGLALAWLTGLAWFAAVGVPGRVEDAATATDAIVVLTGGSERVATGLELLADGKGAKLFVSGVHKGVDLGDILRHSGVEAGARFSGRIVLGHAADDTIGNAAETATWMEAEGFRSIRLVTASYHMPRSLVEFRRAMPGVAIVPHPVFPDAFKQRGWWRWPGTAHLLAVEWTKYLAALARGWVVPKKD
jgi:uncharacterized SAM-binding protein YcdF (DUF218 family)